MGIHQLDQHAYVLGSWLLRALLFWGLLAIDSPTICRAFGFPPLVCALSEAKPASFHTATAYTVRQSSLAITETMLEKPDGQFAVWAFGLGLGRVFFFFPRYFFMRDFVFWACAEPRFWS